MTVCNQAVQLHGAIGITDEYELALHLQRALRICAALGNSFVHRRRYARYAPHIQAAA
jgi:alkylation response protein AidB-like acyl-CoA dehydrogenase